MSLGPLREFNRNLSVVVKKPGTAVWLPCGCRICLRMVDQTGIVGKSETEALQLSSRKATHLGGARAWLVWSLAALAFGYAFFQRVTPGVMVSDLMREFAIGGGMLGMLSALYFYPYVLLQVPLGAIIDRLGARLLMFGALTLAGIGSFLFAAADSLAFAYVGRILIGVGSAVGFLASLAIAANWFSPKRFALLTGLAMFFALMSGVLGQGPLALFIEAYGWRASQWLLGVFGILLAILILIFVRNEPPEMDGVPTRPVESWASVWGGLVKAVLLGNTWKIAFVAAALSGPMLTIAALWGTPYLMRAYGLPRPEAAFWVSLMLFGWAVGAPISGWLSDHLQKRKALLVGGLLVQTLVLGMLSLVAELSLYGTIGLMVIGGLAGSTMVSTYALVRETSTTDIRGSVTGIVNSMTVASGAVLQPMVGLILDLVWDGTMDQGSRQYQTGDYQSAFLVVFAASVLGLIISLTLKEKT